MINLENAEFAIQKEGRLTEGSLEWLNQRLGTDFPVVADPFDRTRELRDAATGITITGYSNGDVLKAVACGMADYGIAGEDKLEELLYPQNKPYQLPEGGFNRYGNMTAIGVVQPALCRLVLARRQGEQGRPLRRVATSYPNLTRQMLRTRGVPDTQMPEIDVFSGSIEPIARRNGYDAVVDITQTGETLRENDFEETDQIRVYSSVVIQRFRDPLSPELFDALKNNSVMDVLWRRLQQRKANPTSSLASKLVSSPGNALRKWNEEKSEFEVAFIQGDVPEIELEAADVLFSLCAMLVQAGVDPNRIMTELAGRYQGQDLQIGYFKNERQKLARPLRY